MSQRPHVEGRLKDVKGTEEYKASWASRDELRWCRGFNGSLQDDTSWHNWFRRHGRSISVNLLSTRQVVPGTNKMQERDCRTWSYIHNVTSIYKNFVNMKRKTWKHLGLIYLWACSCVINQIVVGMSNPESWNSPVRHFLRWCKYSSWNTLPTKNSPQSFFPSSQRPWPSHMSSSLCQLLTYSQWRAQGCNCQTLFVALWCTWSYSCQWEGGCLAWWGVPDCGTKYFSVQLHLPRRNNDPVCQTQWCPLSAET